MVEHMNALGNRLSYNAVKLILIRNYDGGRECCMHDPYGMLWHFGELYE
jgi:hypothetical protein